VARARLVKVALAAAAVLGTLALLFSYFQADTATLYGPLEVRHACGNTRIDRVRLPAGPVNTLALALTDSST
jgi:hypothetical protein